MNAIEHIVTLSNAPWVMWIILLELVLFVIAMLSQPKLLRTAWQMAFKRTERVYNDAVMVGLSSLALRLFCLLSVAMSAMLFMYEEGPFTFAHYLLIASCLFGWYLLRWGIREGLSWLGRLKHYGFPSGFMMSLNLIVGLVLSVCNLGCVLTNNWVGWHVVMVAIVGVWLITIAVKHFQCFVRGWKSFLLTSVYWLIVEVGAIIGLYFLIKVL